MKAILLCFLAIMTWQLPLLGQQLDIEAPPISYSETADHNPVSDLVKKLKAKEVKLAYERDKGYLRDLLQYLDIPVESQSLVFSKTSLQVEHISRRNPRAIYFNDDVYVGWVRGSSLVEISTADANLGAVFYTFDMKPWSPKIERANYSCLGCHLSTLTQGVPGHTVRSVFPSHDGNLDLRRKSFTTDHKSPFAERWGGWYVTGQHGAMTHMGNATLRDEVLDTQRSLNRMDLQSEFDTDEWLTPDSDIVAQMVLQHQTQMHNVFTRTAFAVRRMDHEIASAAAISPAGSSQATSEQEFQYFVSKLAKEVVDYLLFCGEAELTSAIVGSSSYAEVFAARGPRDERGHSLREFDLQTRLFKYPCSYLIYSPAFDSLPEKLKSQVIARLKAVLGGEDESAEYDHLTPAMRQDILEILVATKADFKS
jgi:hypothetical protein